jgi:riboflavin synthase
MFTGLVEAVGEVTEVKPTTGGSRLRLSTQLAPELANGDSLAVNGVCLTVVAADNGGVHMDVSPETARLTTLGAIRRGALVNLERPLRADARLGGHFVQGHVDAVGEIDDLRPDADFHWLTVRYPSTLAPFMVVKGSIAVDGVSLTIADLTADRFRVQLVPFTIAHTNLGRAAPHDRVNLEADIVGKYVVRAAELAGVTLTGRRGDSMEEQPS